MIATDFTGAGLSEREVLLCRFSRELTLSFRKDSMIVDLKNAGLTDNAIFDATLVVAYFNFVNRIVMALGVKSDRRNSEDIIIV